MLALGGIYTKFKKSLHEFNPLFFCCRKVVSKQFKRTTVTKPFFYELVQNKFLKSKQDFQRDDNFPRFPTKKKNAGCRKCIDRFPAKKINTPPPDGQTPDSIPALPKSVRKDGVRWGHGTKISRWIICQIILAMGLRSRARSSAR